MKCKFTKKPNNALKYTLCGLDYIYLHNGYHIENIDGQEYLSIDNADELHAEIANNIVLFKNNIEGQDVRFLRAVMKLTQRELSELLRDNIRTIQNWEQNRHDSIDPLKADVIRMLYWGFVGKNVNIIDEFRKIKDKRGKNEVIALEKKTKKGWQVAAA
jgi:putative transcriptional regulator